jgi:hypothetical protein
VDPEKARTKGIAKPNAANRMPRRQDAAVQDLKNSAIINDAHRAPSSSGATTKK